jgi:septal ring factor EnvC (AmiA/AmiB activator)
LTEPFSAKYLKKLIGRTDIEDALKRLDRLTQEEARMAAAQVLKVTNTVDDRVQGIADNILGVDNRVADVGDRLQEVNEQVMGVDDRVKDVIDQVIGVKDRVTDVDDRVKAMDDKIAAVVDGG